MRELQRRRNTRTRARRRRSMAAGAVVLGVAVALTLAIFGGQLVGPWFAGLWSGILFVGGSMVFLVFLFFVAIRVQRVNFH